ncbi:acetyltransferase [Streptomyces lydicus]|uniref:Acetyltransferase n=1 Tax=Streptomyces lydicus TaxID=47763 RepID=A0A3Q9K7I0_9ACTN|nr:DUF6640 family protein [Streptomyces lydicus]AZS73092.1 acetyltransferase [Streptomyces lydicus]
MSSNSADRASDSRQGTKPRTVAGKVMLTVVAVVTGISPYLADWNETHVLNPLWTPHARFHNGQTMAMGTLLALATLYFVWRRRGDARTNLYAATGFAALYWVSQAAAILYPGAAYFDPRFDTPDMYIGGLPVQAILEIVMFGLIAGAAVLSRPALSPYRPALSPRRPDAG